MKRWRKTVLAAVAGVALAGCQSLWPRKPQPMPPEAAPAPAPVVLLPRAELPPPPTPAAAPRSCVPKALSPAPRYPDTDAALRAAAGAADRYQLMAAGRILREQRLDELERVIAACR